ncbi:MAG TPA: cobalamin biosynthesis protein [Aeromicrobium sp.]|nr:cobalamin biosynthesis protein [Aeromicrobium sp.]
MVSARALGLLAGYLADRIWGDPARAHPVAGFGAVATRLERHVYADDRRAGATHTATLVGGAALAGIAVERATAQRPVVRFLATAATTWAVLGGRSLEDEAIAVRDLLAAGDLPAARGRLTHLVGRDTDGLDESGIARAVIESVAENTSDAVVAPLLAGAVAGIPGLIAYRAANTLDAMVGHRNDRYTHFGWAAARLDDILNWLPARITATLAALLAPAVGGRPSDAFGVWRRDAAGHPSPNAGPVEAAFAGALGVQLGGVNQYGGHAEDRHALGDGRRAEPGDIEAAARLARLVGDATISFLLPT